MGNDHVVDKKNKKNQQLQPRTLDKVKLDVACLKVKGYLELNRDRRINQAINKEKVLVQCMHNAQRVKVDEYQKFSSLVQDVNYIESCNLVLRCIEIIKEQSIKICQSGGDPAKIIDLMPFIETTLWGAGQLNLQSVQEFKDLIVVFFGASVYDINAFQSVDPELKNLYKTALPDAQDINNFALKFADKYGISNEILNTPGHMFRSQQQPQQISQQFQQPNYNGQNQFQNNPQGQNPYGQQGQNPQGQNQGQNPNPYGPQGVQNPYGQNAQQVQNPYGQNQQQAQNYGQNPYNQIPQQVQVQVTYGQNHLQGQNPYGQIQQAQNPYGQNQLAQAQNNQYGQVQQPNIQVGLGGNGPQYGNVPQSQPQSGGLSNQQQGLSNVQPYVPSNGFNDPQIANAQPQSNKFVIPSTNQNNFQPQPQAPFIDLKAKFQANVDDNDDNDGRFNLTSSVISHSNSNDNKKSPLKEPFIPKMAQQSDAAQNNQAQKAPVNNGGAETENLGNPMADDYLDELQARFDKLRKDNE